MRTQCERNAIREGNAIRGHRYATILPRQRFSKFHFVNLPAFTRLDSFVVVLEESLKVGSVKRNQKVFSSEKHTLRTVPIHPPLLLMADFILHLVSTMQLQKNQELELLQNSSAANIPDPCLAVALYDV